MRGVTVRRGLIAASFVVGLTGAPALAADRVAIGASMFREGVQADLAGRTEQAYVFYRLAAQAGIAEAEFNVAVMDDSGVGAPRDREQAALWYARAASHDFQRASYDLGELAAAGDGCPRNPELARRWFEAAGNDARARGQTSVASVDVPPTPVLDDVQVDPPAVAAADEVQVELVWRMAAMPDDTRFFVQLERLDSDGRHDVAWDATTRPALLLSVPRQPGLFAWRVLAASASSGHYTPSSWATFKVR